MRGARQVGKTWLLREFGREHYRQTVYINFESAKELQSIFDQDYDVNRIVHMFQMYAQTNIDEDTLIILDEIQAAPKGLTALKYFCEDAPQYHIMAAGSLLGVAVRRKSMTVPVGKVKMVRMYPLTFVEYLQAADESLFHYIDELQEITLLPTIILNKLLLEYRR